MAGQTAKCITVDTTLTLLFCFGRPVLPVDTHLHRVSGRLGLIGPKVSADKAHKELLALLPDDEHVLYNFHIGMLKHGQKICVWNTPHCQNCVLTVVCNYFQTNLKTDSQLNVEPSL